MQKTQILLSTYNGERFLREQLDSYTKLEGFSDIKLLIRDDGSEDGTLEILKEYRERYGFEIIEGENMGLNASMNELILHRDPECEFYAFSDQDDVWLPHKVKKGIDTLLTMGEGPAFYTSCSSLTDAELNITGQLRVPGRKLSFYNAMVESVSAGHTQIFNREFMEILAKTYTPGVVLFDHFVYMLATVVAKTTYDAECTTLYRQHGNNVVGYSSSFFGRLKIQLRALARDVTKKTTGQLMVFRDTAQSYLDERQKRELNRFLDSQRNFFTRLGYLFRAKIYRQVITDTVVVKLLYLFGCYKYKDTASRAFGDAQTKSTNNKNIKEN